MKKVIVTLSVLMVTAMARASFLYWQLDSDYAGDYTNVRINTNDGGEGDNSIDLVGVTYDEATQQYVVDSASAVQPGATYIIDSADITDEWSYYVEYSKDGGNTYESYGKPISGGDLISYAQDVGATAEDIASGTEVASVWHVASGTYSVTPEPTSAILMMFGMAFLGLKRKNRSRA